MRVVNEVHCPYHHHHHHLLLHSKSLDDSEHGDDGEEVFDRDSDGGHSSEHDEDEMWVLIHQLLLL